MKILKSKYPKGTLKHQKTDGRYIDGYLYENLEILAKSIIKDMTFLGIGFSSTLEVGTGKSVLFTQIGEAWTYIVNKLHGTNLTFTQKNIVFRPKDLIDRAFEVPKYSCILVDEWEDAHYWSELGMTLRQFFRKCRQLNLFILIIIPNFFQLPMNYAIGRSIFAIDVKFGASFERGFFEFYNFKDKKYLFIKGKKFQNYDCQDSSFRGVFGDGYGIPEEEYRQAKFEDLKRTEDESEKKKLSEYDIKINIVRKIYDKKDFLMKEGINYKNLGTIFGVAERTMNDWILKSIKRDENLNS